MTTGRPVLVDPQSLERLTCSSPRGLDRLIGGRFGLDRILAATAATPEAMQAISKERVERMRADREAERRRVAEVRRNGTE